MTLSLVFDIFSTLRHRLGDAVVHREASHGDGHEQASADVWGTGQRQFPVDRRIVGWAKPTGRANARPMTGSACPPFTTTPRIDGGHGASAPLPTLRFCRHHRAS